MPAMPHASGSSPKRMAYARMEASTARACLRRLSPWVNSLRMAQACSRFMASRGSASFDLLGLRHPPERLDLSLEQLDALQQVLDGLGHRIGKIGLVQIDARAHPLAVLVGDLARHPYHHRVGRYIADDDGASADAAVLTDGEGAEYSRTGAHHHVITQSGMALLPLEAGPAECDPLQQRHILAHLGRLSDHHAHAMIDEDSPAQPGRRMDLDAGERARDVRGEAGQGRP